MEELRLNEFKTTYMVLKRGVPWLDHLILGLLVWLEDRIIYYRVINEVDKAIEDYKRELEAVNSVPKPIYREKPVDPVLQPGESALLGGEMRLSAPWCKNNE